MKKDDLSRRLHELSFTCGMNQRYHQILERRWAVLDRSIRVAVGAMSVWGLVLAMPGYSPSWGLGVAIASLIVAIALNIIPLGDWQKLHAQLFHSWSELRKDVEQEKVKACELDDEDSVPDYVADRVCELTGKEHDLDADEPAPLKKLLKRCHDDEKVSRLGPPTPAISSRLAEAVPAVRV